MKKDYQIPVSIPREDALMRLSTVIGSIGNPLQAWSRNFVGAIHGHQFSLQVPQVWWAMLSPPICSGRVDAHGRGSVINYTIEANTKTSTIFLIVIGIILLLGDGFFALVDVGFAVANRSDENLIWLIFSELAPFLRAGATITVIVLIIFFGIKWKIRSDEKAFTRLFNNLFRDVMIR